mmetsp:Transcript_38952/g.43069  ORF Transcript_38952/g.43069 Transcript_38952/m.43069 type:complete len:785 (-) Transcript_38952:464-2818(-)
MSRWRMNGTHGRIKSDTSLDTSTRSPSSASISLSSSPSTPPKKAWERQYRSFLSKRGGSHDNTPEGGNKDISGNVSDVHADYNRGNTTGGAFSLVPGTRRLLVRRGSNERGSSQPPSIPVLTKTKSSEDMTVKGGKFFSQMFHNKDNAKKWTHNRRKAKSMGSLDQTIRRGAEKSYSPTIGRFITESQEVEKEKLCSPTLPSGLHASLEYHRKTKASGLPETLTICAKKPATIEIKKAFTEIHNSSAYASDSTSAYLGEDTSTRGKTYLAMYNQLVTHHKDCMSQHEGGRKHAPPNTGVSKSLEPMSEEYLRYNSRPLLKAILGPETWKENRRYLIIPAILATCPLGVMSTLSGSREIKDFDDSPFGILKLGAATMTFVVGQQRVDNSGWSACSLELRQNYLLEYDRDSTGIPRGFAHLQYARASPHADFLNALELEFYGSPCVRGDKRKLLIRVERTADRDRWVSYLNAAAQLNISDLYDYDKKENVLGSGRYATVYKARRRDAVEETTNRALKIVDKKEFWSRVVKGRERADTIVREVSVQATLSAKGDRCASVVKIFGLFETVDSIVMECELLAGIDLFEHLSSKSVLNEDEAAMIIRDILTGLAAMNRYGVSHRDIKPANILMNDIEKDGFSVKVADFGMSTFVGVDGLLRGRCGTPGYVAPEIFTAGVGGGYGNKVDVFSAGVTLYIMLCGYEPFYGETDKELIDANRNAILEFSDGGWDRVSPEARGLVENMLEVDPNKRISASEALKHPWISSRMYDNPCPQNPPTGFADGAACSIS